MISLCYLSSNVWLEQDGGNLVGKDNHEAIQVLTERSYTTAELQRRNRELAKANLTIQLVTSLSAILSFFLMLDRRTRKFGSCGNLQWMLKDG